MPAEVKESVKTLIQRVVETTAEERRIGWKLLFSDRREPPELASARVLAMAVCCAANVPMHVVARAFNRTWQTVDSARRRQTQLAMNDAVLRDEFIRILTRAFGGEVAS